MTPAPPFRVGVMQLTMEPLEEVLEHARVMERLAVGWGIISPYTRHPIQIAMEARVTQEAAGPGRFYLGLGVSKIFMRHAGVDGKPVAAMREAAEIVRGIL